MEYEFLFAVEGVSVESDLDVGVVFDEFDGLLYSHHGRHLLAVAGTGCEAVDAAHRLTVRLRRALPDIRLLRLDLDLVGVSDIAERAERSRQNVLQWVNGERRGDQPFPAPEGTAGRSLVWRWGEVHGWLARFGEGDGVHVPARDEALAIDMYLPLWQQAVDDGKPMVKVLVPQDGRAHERAEVARALEGPLHDAVVREAISALPRTDKDRLVIACAVLADPLRTVLDQIAPDDVSGLLAVRVGESELKLVGVASRPIPGTRPISELGLTPEATVGDLVLELAHAEHASSVPLTLV